VLLIPFDFFSRYSVILKNLGLSEYEIRVFLTLLLSGSLCCKVLSHDSGVPTGKIYQVLSILESKGFVEVSQEKPKVFRAVEPKKALRRRLRQIEDDFFDLELKTREALQTLQLQYSLRYDEIQGVVSEIFDVGSSSESRIRESLLKAEDEVLFSTGEALGRLNIEDLCKVLLERGVKIRAIVSLSSIKNIEKFDRLSSLGVNMRQFDSELTKYFVVDDKYVSLLIDGQEDQTWVQIHGHSLCRVLRGKFLQDWNRASLFRRQPRPYGISAF
jgi:sugar-specific transcriptional regulator TrmB